MVVNPIMIMATDAQEIELGPIETNNVLVSQGIIPEMPVVEEIGPAAIQPGNVEIINRNHQ